MGLARVELQTEKINFSGTSGRVSGVGNDYGALGEVNIITILKNG